MLFLRPVVWVLRAWERRLMMSMQLLPHVLSRRTGSARAGSIWNLGNLPESLSYVPRAFIERVGPYCRVDDRVYLLLWGASGGRVNLF